MQSKNNKKAEKENNTDNSDNTRSNLYWNTLIRIPTEGIAFVISIINARILVPGDFGILAITMMMIGYANLITNLGLNGAIIQRRIVDKRIINSIFTIDLGISTILVVVFLLLAGCISTFFNSPECKDVIKVSSLMFIISTFSGVSMSILKRDMVFKTVSLIDVTQTLLCVFLTLILAVNHFGYWSLVYGKLIPHLIIAIISCVKARWVPLLQYRHSLMKGTYNFGLWSFLGSQLQFISEFIDKLIIGRFLGTVSLGFYDKARSIAMMPLRSLTMNINAVMFSSFSEYQDNMVELQNKFKKALTLISIINMPIYAGLIVVAPYFVHAFLGDKWAPMITPFQILLIACVFGSFGGLISSLNVGMGNYKMHTVLKSIGLLVFVACCFFLLRFELCGIALSFMVYIIIACILTTSFAISKINISWKDFVCSVLPGLLGSSIMYSILKVLSLYYLPDYTFKNFCVLTGSGIIVYVLYMFLEKSESAREIKTSILSDIAHKCSVFCK